MTPLAEFEKSVYSQYGEDGVIGEMLERLKRGNVQLDQWCVEFGAWDGVHLSNTYNLISNYGYKAVLIEADPGAFKKLEQNVTDPGVHKICRFVQFEGPDSLDEILKTADIPKDFDFLSIDIDGCDYHIFESLKAYAPKIVCIEHNFMIPNDVSYVQERDMSIRRGAGAKAIIELAGAKGYELAAVTESNVILIQTALAPHVLGDSRPALEDLRGDSEIRTYVFPGYDGAILSNRKEIEMPWHRMPPVPVERLQVMPAFLRGGVGMNYSVWRLAAFRLWRLYRFPADGWRRMTNSKRLRRIIGRFTAPPPPRQGALTHIERQQNCHFFPEVYVDIKGTLGYIS